MTPPPEPHRVLAKAVRAAARALALSPAELAAALGQDGPDLALQRLDPASAAGARALQLLRLHRRLAALTGGDPARIAQWLRTANRHTGGVPVEQIRHAAGLARVVAYLEAMR